MTVLADGAAGDTALRRGAALLAKGRAAQAARTLARACALAPHSAAAHAQLASALQAEGRMEDAARAYLRAVELEPALLAAWFGLAACRQSLGQANDAMAAYRRVLQADPAHPESHYGLALLSGSLGRAEDAERHLRAAVAADPDFAEAHLALGNLLARSAAPQAAEPHFRAALDVDPAYLEARVALGMALLRQERAAEAEAQFRAVLALDPGNAAVHHGLGCALLRDHRHQEAEAAFRGALAITPHHVEALIDIGHALLGQGKVHDAIASCEAALAIVPGHPRALATLGGARAEIGELDLAADLCRQAFMRAPEQIEFALRLFQIVRVRPGDPVLTALERRLAHSPPPAPREMTWLHFALAKAYEDLGDRALGFSHLLQGNALRRAQVTYDEAGTLDVMARMAGVFTRDLLAARAGAGCAAEAPVFILGMPRSGTTLVEQMLSSHPAVFPGGERTDLMASARCFAGAHSDLGPFPEALWAASDAALRQIGADYAAALDALAPEATRITDKMPANFQMIGLIRLILPRARIIHLVRDPVDTCLSCFSKLFGGELNFTYDLSELGRYCRAYQQMMAHWRGALPEGTMLEVRYEALVADPEREARRILAYCGLGWDDSVLRYYENPRPVHTASIAQVRQPIYRSSVGRWRPDEAVLRPLLEALSGPALRPPIALNDK